MNFIETYKNKVFTATNANFNELALELFHFQANNNNVYQSYLDHLKINPNNIEHIEQIPCLPIDFFKQNNIKSIQKDTNDYFMSSGTTQQTRSKHYIYDYSLYENSIKTTFEKQFGSIQNYNIIALVPDFNSNPHSSLAYMLNYLIKSSRNANSGFYLDTLTHLDQIIERCNTSKKQNIIFSLSYALLDLVNLSLNINLSNSIIIETGGMKGKKKELTREELHHQINTYLKPLAIYSEYSMAELFSQAYTSKNSLNFIPPPWMRIIIKDFQDPFQLIQDKNSGKINIIDLANIYTCAFIETNDLGKTHKNTFEVLGRIDNSDLRGCNLMTL